MPPLADGGLSYMVYHGLNAMFGKQHDPKEGEKLSQGYHSAVEDMENERPVADNLHIRFDKNRYSR